jgi:DNA-binding LacI/PurR family transcriptional regulator
MKPFQALSAVEQLAGHLREEIQRGALGGEMPGTNQLAASLGCSARTVHAAVKQLEAEGFLQGQGTGRRSRIALPETSPPPALRVKILLYQRMDERDDYIVDLRHRLQEAGHTAGFAAKTLCELGMDAKRVGRFAANTEADAWIVVAASREVLEWFVAQPVPAFALFGRQTSVTIAGTGPQKSSSVAAVVRRLAGIGHSRIVCLAREERRKPGPGLSERVFLEELQAQGIAVGPYNLPDWEDNPAGFLRCLSSLFRNTPPTALIISTMELFTATQQFLLHQGIRVPQDVSIVCTDPHPAFSWCVPSISHIDYDSSVWVRNVVRWVNGVAHGKNGRRKIFNEANFIEGGTMGPAKA